MDRLEAMMILLRVVEKGSFSAASRDLGVPLATVSRKVNELEGHLGTRLLVRTTRKVALTDAGTTYVASARRILDEIDETERIAAGEFHVPRGELILTAPFFFGRLHILPVVTEFLAAYPEINVRLLLSDRNLHLIEDHVDMAVRIGSLPDSLHDRDPCRIDADGGMCQPEVARGARRTQISRGPGRTAVRQL
jgi:DNA-binding transcriptional LysR family regulator